MCTHRPTTNPGTRATQEGLQQELAQMAARFPDAKARDLKRFLMGYGMKADKAIPAYEAHLQWCVSVSQSTICPRIPALYCT